MYRQSLKMERENEQFITRLASLPVVSSGIAQVYSAYQKTKDYNGLLRSTCNMAETGLQTMVSSTMPYVEKYKPKLDMVNSFACQKLSMMEEQYPIITRPTDELIKEGMDKCASLVKPVTDRVSSVVGKGQETIEATKGRVGAVKEYGVMTLTRTLDTPLAKYAMEKVNEALTVSEDYVEKYLPAGDDEAQDKGAVVDEVSALTRVSSLSSKLRQRMYKRAMRDLSGLQMRSKEQLEKLNFTVDLIQYAKSSATEVKDTLEEKYEVAQRKMADYWEQINEEGEEEEEEGEKPMTLEGRTLMVARRVTRQMKTGFATVSGYMPVKLQPTVVRERMENALKFTEELYASFKNAKSYADMPAWVLTQTRERMAYIQETVSFLTEMFIVSPINWLTDSKKSIDLQEVTQRNRPDPEEIAMEMTSMSSNDPPARREPVEMPPRREPMEMKTEPQSEPYGRKMEREEMMEDMEEEENADDLD